MKIQLKIAIDFIASKDNYELCMLHSKSDKKEIKIHDKSDEVIEKLFESLLNRYQNSLETSVRGIDFVFDCVHLLYYKCHKINQIVVDHI